MKKRLDMLIFDRELVDSREKGQRLIMAGQVLINNKKETKPGSKFDEKVEIEVLESPKYVGRGAEKLEKATRIFRIDFQDKVVCDVGSSTGGFTDFAIQNGAKKIYAIDVGKGQLDWKLRNDPRVVVMESVNFRYLESLPERIDIFLIDVSFISVRKILEHLKKLRYYDIKILKSASENEKISQYPNIPISAILLFKPQFEAGKAIADKFRGVIKDPEIHEKLLNDFRKWCKENEFDILGEVRSPILGAKGNTEFLFNLRIT